MTHLIACGLCQKQGIEMIIIQTFLRIWSTKLEADRKGKNIA